MKRFLIKLLVFSIPILVLIPIGDYWISFYLKQSVTYPGEYQVMNDIYSGEAECDIAIYGSSRAWVQVSPEVLKNQLGLSAYNFGVDGHGFKIQHLRHLEYKKHNKSPKYIILCLDRFSFSQGENLYQPDQFLPYMLWNYNIYKYTKNYDVYSVYDYIIPLVRYAGKKGSVNIALRNSLYGNNYNGFRVSGYAPIDKEWTKLDLKKIPDSSNIKAHIDPMILNLFLNFIEDCNDNNVELILVFPPEYNEYRHLFFSNDDIISFYNFIAKKYDLEFYNFLNHNISNQKDLFYNFNHLNREGSILFTKILADKINKNIIN